MDKRQLKFVTTELNKSIFYMNFNGASLGKCNIVTDIQVTLDIIFVRLIIMMSFHSYPYDKVELGACLSSV